MNEGDKFLTKRTDYTYTLKSVYANSKILFKIE